MKFCGANRRFDLGQLNPEVLPANMHRTREPARFYAPCFASIQICI